MRAAPKRRGSALCEGYDAGLSPGDGDVAVGMVVLRVESPVFSYSGKRGVQTSLVNVILPAGWTYTVARDGGFDAPVELEIRGGTCSARLKALHKAGETRIDGGWLTCR